MAGQDAAKVRMDQISNAYQRMAELTDETRKSNAVRGFLEQMSKFHHYSPRNQMLIWLQRRDATRVAGFNTWRSFGRWVRKGEHGIEILAPTMVKVRNAENGKDEEVLAGFHTTFVFDVAQTDGKELAPEPRWFVEGDSGAEFIAAIVAHMTADGVKVEWYVPEGSEKGYSLPGEVAIDSRLSPLGKVATLLHEWAHERLHQSNAALDGLPLSREEKELEAEGVSFVVRNALHLPEDTASAVYLALWQADPEKLAKRFDRISRAARYMLGKLQPTAEAEPQPATA